MMSKALLLLSAAAASHAANPVPHTALWDGAYIAATRGSPALVRAVRAVAASAEHYASLGPYSVMDKKEVAASGDKHDFYCGATYFWPCNVRCAEARNYQGEKFNCSAWSNVPNDEGLPDSWPGPCDLATGLPWTSHDLYADSYWEAMDRDAFDKFNYAFFPLVMSWLHTGNAAHGQRAVLLLRTWFLNPRTRMNAATGMHWAAAEPGRYPNGAKGPGDQGGVVEFNRFQRTLDLVAILEWADADGTLLTAADRSGMRDWTTAFVGWWVFSGDGMRAANISNNIGSGYTTNALSMCHFLRNDSLCNQIVSEQAASRLARQLAPDGHLPLEDTDDPDSFGYHMSDVIALQDLAFAANNTDAGAGIYEWVVPNSTAYYGGGGSLKKMIDFIVPTCLNFSNWPFYHVNTEGFDSGLARCPFVLRRAARDYKNATMAKLADTMAMLHGQEVDGYFSWHLNMTDFLDLLYPPLNWTAPPTHIDPPNAAAMTTQPRGSTHGTTAKAEVVAATATSLANTDARCSSTHCVLNAFKTLRTSGEGSTLRLLLTSTSINGGAGLLNTGSCLAKSTTAANYFCQQITAVIGGGTSGGSRIAAPVPVLTEINATFVVRSAGSNLTLQQLKISNQRYYASALYVTNGGFASVVGCSFEGNSNLAWWDPVNKVPGSYTTSPDWGGAGAITVHSTAMGLSVLSSAFSSNAGVVGGAIRLGAMMGDRTANFPTTAVVIANSTFQHNTGLASKEGVDLAIYWDGQHSWTNEAANNAGTTGRGCIWPTC